MKRWLGITTILCVCMILYGCGDFRKNYSLEKRDVVEFSTNLSSYGVTDDLIPENFVDNFEYVDGYFYYFCHSKSYFSLDISDRTLVFFEYDTLTYNNAKEYVFETLNLSSKPIEKYNGYVFYEIYTDSTVTDFPYKFKRIAYNDSGCILIFIGCFMDRNFDDHIDEVINDWGVFLDKYYGQWYDFSQ